MKLSRATVGAILFGLCLAAAGRAFAQGAPAPQNSTSTIIQRVLVKVNGEVYTQKELEQAQIDALQSQGKTNPTSQDLEAITPDLLVNALDRMLLVQRGRELGFHLSDENFKSSVDRIKSENKLDDAGLKAALAEQNLTLDSLREELEKQYIVQQVQQREILAHMNLTEEEMHQYYDKHPDEFVKPATVMLREVLVSVPADSKNAAQPFQANLDTAAKEKATALRDRALKGEDFPTLVTEASDAPSKSNGGLIGPVSVTDMSTGIRDALDKMQAGDLTPIFRTTRGYQFFKLESRTAAVPQAFDTVRDEISQKVGEARLDAEQTKYLRQLRAQALIEWKRDDLRQMYEKRLAEIEK